jgi:hypothetical protein
MAGKLDEISVSIGSLLAKVENLGTSIAANRSEADRRHRENTDRLNRIDEVLKPVAAAVAKMEPIVEDYRTNRNKALGLLLGLAGIASALGLFASELKAMVFRK